MGFCLLPEAEAELDDIWLYLARASGSIEIAHRLIDTITDRFFLLGQYPQMGRRRDHDLRPGLRSFPRGGVRHHLPRRRRRRPDPSCDARQQGY